MGKRKPEPKLKQQETADRIYISTDTPVDEAAAAITDHILKVFNEDRALDGLPPIPDDRRPPPPK